ncbi:MAG: hypothetical protein QXD51_04670 [Candidatus Anstonellales archaeon]
MVKMAGDDKKGKGFEIKPEEKTASLGLIPKKSYDSKELLSQIFSDETVIKYKQTHEKEFREFCKEFDVSPSEENFEKWARLTLAWNALRYAGLFGINYKSDDERLIELGEKGFRNPLKILSQLFSGQMRSPQTAVTYSYSGYYASYYDCDESAKLFRDIVDLLWPEYSPRFVLLGDTHAGVRVDFDGVKIAFDLTHGSVIKFEPSDVNPDVGKDALNTISAINKKGKGLNNEESIAWTYINLPLFKSFNEKNYLSGMSIPVLGDRYKTLVSYFNHFFYKPQPTLDLLKELTRLYYGYSSRLDSNIEMLLFGPDALSLEDVLFVAEKFLDKSTIPNDSRDKILSLIKKSNSVQFGLGLTILTLLASQKTKVDPIFVDKIIISYNGIIKEAEKYGLTNLEAVALVSFDPFFIENIEKNELSLFRLSFGGQFLLGNLIINTKDERFALLLADNNFIDPEVYKTILERLIKNNIQSEEIWNVIVSMAENSKTLREESLGMFSSSLTSDAVPEGLKHRIRAMLRV